MTTYQDPPPQSRRSARQSERADQEQTPQNPTGSFVTEIPAAQPSPAPQSSPGPQPSPAPLAAAAPPAGRRASRVAEQGLYDVAPEPLTYMTNGQATGAYDIPIAAAQHTAQPTAQPTPHAAPQPTVDASATEAAYTMRDFSPEGGRGRRSAVPLIEPASPTDLNYRTQQVQPPVEPPQSEQKLSRRELRERAAAEQAAAYPAVAPQQVFHTGQPLAAQQPATTQQPGYPPQAQQFTGQQPIASQSAPQQAVPHQAAPHQFTGQQPTAQPPVAPPASGGRRAAPSAPPPPTNLTSAMAEFDTLTRAGAIQPGGGARVAAPPGYPQAPTQPPAGLQPPPPQTTQLRTGQQPTAHPQAAQHQASRARQPVPMKPDVEQTGGWVAPAGHWSRQADLDDETQEWSGTITRDVGIGNVSTTTSTLIVPNAPKLSDFPAALTSTGEVLLTGSIDLPRSLSALGTDSRRYDDPNVDHMFDSHDGEFTATNSTPVRAAKAVSTHTSARGTIGASAPHGNRMWTVLFVSAFVLAVVVAGLFVYVANNGL
jgi:hypothetical protein